MFAHDVLRFANKYGLDKFDILGHSMGARVAMTMTCMFPERIDGVISIDAGPKKYGGESFYKSDVYELMKNMIAL